MGVYDTYGNTQLKVGDCILKSYDIGDKVDILDGVYVAPDGVVVVINGIFVAEFDHLTDKYGCGIMARQMLGMKFKTDYAGKKLKGKKNG